MFLKHIFSEYCVGTYHSRR